MTDEPDFRKYYYDEKYLLDEVGPRFRKSGLIDPADFYMILIWKANRAKNRLRDRLKRMDKDGSFSGAVAVLASQLFVTTDQSEKLRVLMATWGFYLPTATAILTILYPHDFTVYDYRVAEELEFADLSQRSYTAKLWDQYVEFRSKVILAAPKTLEGNLRDCDRFITGRSFRRQLEVACQS